MPTLPRGVYRRGGSFYVRFRHEGKWKHKSAGPDLSNALELHEKLRSGIEHAPEVVRFDHLVERYRKHLDIREIRDKLDRKAEQAEVEDLELRVRDNEKTLTRHRTIFGVVSAGVAALFGVSR